MALGAYLVISPAKDEEGFIEHTLRSMLNQTHKPVRWIIVDDGSSDGTLKLIEEYAKNNHFIHIVRSPRGKPRQPGSAVIRAFNQGYEEAQTMGLKWDFIVKLDCDLSFEADYFENLARRFMADARLGIASGIYFENEDGRTWEEIEMPPYHAAGASKMIRRECWEQIGGFAPTRGWDTVDEIRAMARGWRTAHFRELHLKHWKPEGTGIGMLKTNAMHGEIYYLTGGGVVFFLVKVLHRLMKRPFIAGGMAVLWGYAWATLSRRDRLVTAQEANYYRSLLNSRLVGIMRGKAH